MRVKYLIQKVFFPLKLRNNLKKEKVIPKKKTDSKNYIDIYI